MTNESTAAGRRSLRAVLATVVVVLVIISIFTSTVFADTFNGYDVKIIDNAQELSITTNETEPIEILKTAGITLGSDDKIDIAEFKEGEGGTIVINRLNSINVEFDNTVKTYSVYSSTVGEALAEIGATVSEKDEINYSLSDNVKDGMVIDIKSAFSVSLTADGETAKYAIVEGTVKDLLSLAGVTLGEDDYTKPSVDSKLKEDMKVKVYRVEYKDETKTEKIKFNTTKIKDKTLSEDKSKVITKGVDGSKKVDYRVKFVNGKEKSREKLSEETLKKPVDAVVKVGTKPSSGTKDTKSNGVKSKNGYKVGQKISGRYTHYCACTRCTGSGRGITASGKRVHNGMANPYYVACNWLPLGSVISVNGANYLVVDRGGSGLSRRGRIDIYTPEGHSAALKKGSGSCTIEIVRIGW